MADDEPRLVAETGVDARVAAIVEPLILSAGYRLVRVRLSGMNGLTLQIMAEREDGAMSVEDCETLSRLVSPALDVADPIDKAYHLEVSSPGIDRPLVRRSDFTRASGHLAKIETSQMLAERRKFRGKIESVDEDGFVLRADAPVYGDSPTVTIPFSLLSEARLILTDELIRESLRADKARRHGREEDGEASADETGGNEGD
ncbi:MAG TPA: ribosome maturation factor RimP [Rhizobiaceae bacterium]|nr:ribosome maturation factor RimP [Rhizobiaceae bacterium]